VRGRGPSYYVHLRTTRTVFPWSFFGQEFRNSSSHNEKIQNLTPNPG
jgi:hypothetical protein